MDRVKILIFTKEISSITFEYFNNKFGRLSINKMKTMKVLRIRNLKVKVGLCNPTE